MPPPPGFLVASERPRTGAQLTTRPQGLWAGRQEAGLWVHSLPKPRGPPGQASSPPWTTVLSSVHRGLQIKFSQRAEFRSVVPRPSSAHAQPLPHSSPPSLRAPEEVEKLSLSLFSLKNNGTYLVSRAGKTLLRSLLAPGTERGCQSPGEE